MLFLFHLYTFHLPPLVSSNWHCGTQTILLDFSIMLPSGLYVVPPAMMTCSFQSASVPISFTANSQQLQYLTNPVHNNTYYSLEQQANNNSWTAISTPAKISTVNSTTKKSTKLSKQRRSLRCRSDKRKPAVVHPNFSNPATIPKQQSFSGCLPGTGTISGPPQPEKVLRRRVSANKKERRRTMSINGAFSQLRSRIPNVPNDTKLSKIKTLRLASSYIAYLTAILDNDDNSSASDDSMQIDGGFKAIIANVLKAQEESRRKMRVSFSKLTTVAGFCECITSFQVSFVLILIVTALGVPNRLAAARVGWRAEQIVVNAQQTIWSPTERSCPIRRETNKFTLPNCFSIYRLFRLPAARTYSRWRATVEDGTIFSFTNRALIDVAQRKSLWTCNTSAIIIRSVDNRHFDCRPPFAWKCGV